MEKQLLKKFKTWLIACAEDAREKEAYLYVDAFNQVINYFLSLFKNELSDEEV